MDTFASRLRYARNLRHLSQTALARQCKLSQSAISSYENGTRKDPSKILTLAEVLEVNAYWLSEGLGPMLAPVSAGLALSDSTWPFASINPQAFWALTTQQRTAVERTLATLIQCLGSAAPRKPDPDQR